MSVVWAFWLGFGGSIAVEVLAAIRCYYPPRTQLPHRYREIPFYILRLFLALIAGGLAAAYQVQSPILAIHIGASAPLILAAFAQKPP
jgi:hypothetical protein